MAKIVCVTVRDKTLPSDENHVGWGVVVNGRLVALDDTHYSSCASEMAEGLAAALGIGVEDAVVDVEGPGWDWHKDILPRVTALSEPDVVLSVQGDIEDLLKYLDSRCCSEKNTKSSGSGPHNSGSGTPRGRDCQRRHFGRRLLGLLA